MTKTTMNFAVAAILGAFWAPAAWAAPAVPLSLTVVDPEPPLNDCYEGQADIDACVNAYGEHFADPDRFRLEMERMRALQSDDRAVRVASSPSPALQGLIGRMDEVLHRMSEVPSHEDQRKIERLYERASRMAARMWDLEENGRVSSRRHVRLFHRADGVIGKAEEIERAWAVGTGR